ncbi:tRNA (adenosine(37)-N6)-dimethylallyltransferase MiaA [Desulforamulus aquiferis]|uniref:tRNA dimethylallyltransferase n=1 Tax=Desulforamulus aquiferis TaxID=1397668 RepID=A0AAW7ZCJ1_9FIRM|nr:tRNA (adenosine(37)-N6)-dimethylallyltransferase MiaA [Desulforamulus aquiferis]MDO7787414.1 tRNA (adenosine(37)-N6)-dimethylallyltransferase MiaA [Desulforamulus aquiferis]RYD02429.1 hypothetical protein N752_24165 [Desulforamulus aquiferis]
MKYLKPLIVIVGPTAAGKTDVAIELARMVRGEVVSADSMLVYRGMDIGTAKPTKEEMGGIPHHLMDVVEPDQEFSVARYQRLAEQSISGISDRGRLPLLVGGTGLYVRAVIDHYDFSEAPKDDGIREKLKIESENIGPVGMHAKLAEVDPITAGRLHPNDLRRVIRALEVYHQTGKPISQSENNKQSEPKYELHMFGLTMDRKLLYQRIEQRVDLMVKLGLVEEVKGLMGKYGNMGTAMQGLGYKEIALYLEGKTSLEEALELLKRNTRRFAKRQLTWFRADKRIKWIELEKFNNKKEVANEIGQQIAGELSIV